MKTTVSSETHKLPFFKLFKGCKSRSLHGCAVRAEQKKFCLAQRTKKGILDP